MELNIFTMENMLVAGMMMEKIGTFSKMDQNITDMEQMATERNIFTMGNIQTAGTMMEKIGTFSKMVKNLLDELKMSQDIETL